MNASYLKQRELATTVGDIPVRAWMFQLLSLNPLLGVIPGVVDGLLQAGAMIAPPQMHAQCRCWAS